ncbi:uncharacterized protein LOC144342600, partial [Saccoglossus kowalevskii]
VIADLPEIEYTADLVPAPPECAELNEAEYDLETKVHRSEFTNSALSGETEKYVMTAVYQLVPIGELRKKRAGDRPRRSLIASATIPKMKSLRFGFLGCPPESVFIPFTYSCSCLVPGHYNTEIYQCTNETDFNVYYNVEETKKKILVDNIADVSASKTTCLHHNLFTPFPLTLIIISLL